MKNKRMKWLILMGFFYSLSFSARADEPKPELAGSTPPAPTIAAEEKNSKKIQLQFRPRVGEERVLRLNVVQQGVQAGGQLKSVMRQVIGIDTAYRVLSAFADGRLRVRATTRATRFVQEIDGQVTSRFDSSKAAKPSGDQAETVALMQGMSYVLQINADGTINQVENKEKIAEQMMDKMKIPQADRKLLRPLVVGSLQGSAFKNLGNIFASFAIGQVAIGDSWPKLDVVTNDSNLIYAGRLTLAKRSDGLSTLHLKSTTKPDPKRARGAEVLPMAGTQQGYFLVEEKSGWTQRAHIEQRWSARVDDMGRPVLASVKSTRTLYVKMTFDVATLSAK